MTTTRIGTGADCGCCEEDEVCPCGDLSSCTDLVLFGAAQVQSSSTIWFSGGSDYPAGDYRVCYVEGAMGYAFNGDAPCGFCRWAVNSCYPCVTPNCDATPVGGYKVVYNDGIAEEWTKQDGCFHADTATVEAENDGTSNLITHTGGRIGLRLIDSLYSDNEVGDRDPTWCLVPCI